jgi:nitrogen regulatory protein P-II 1
MFLVLFVLNEAEHLQSVLNAWEREGVSGVTILHSSGLGRVRMDIGLRDDLPLMPSLKDLFENEEYFSRTLFSIVKDEPMAERLVTATEKVVGDLHKPGKGLIVIIPLLKAYGLGELLRR